MSADNLGNWIYIDNVKELSDIMHCDTRDFHMLLIDDVSVENPMEKCRFTSNKEDYLFTPEEVLLWLKSLEMESGGKQKWRFLYFNTDVYWLKYIRFYKTEYKGKPYYLAYTTIGYQYIPLSKKVYIPRNIKKNTLNVDNRE